MEVRDKKRKRGMRRDRSAAVLLCLLLSAAVLGGCAQNEELPDIENSALPENQGAVSEGLQVVFQYKMDYWKAYDISCSSIPDRESYEALAGKYLEEIPELLGLQDWWKDSGADTLVLNLVIANGRTDGTSNYLSKGLNSEVETTVTLGSARLAWRESDGSLAHELTHVIAGPSFSIYLEDGLCEYVQNRVGVSNMTSPGLKEQGISSAQCLKAFYAADSGGLLEEGTARRLRSALETVGCVSREYPEDRSSLWYLCNEVFVEYLIEQYGMERTVSLIAGGEDETSYETFLGKSLEELRGDWLAYVDGMKETCTVEEIERIQMDFISEKAGRGQTETGR